MIFLNPIDFLALKKNRGCKFSSQVIIASIHSANLIKLIYHLQHGGFKPKNHTLCFTNRPQYCPFAILTIYIISLLNTMINQQPV